MADLNVAVRIVGEDHLSGPVGHAQGALGSLTDVLGKVGLAGMGLSAIKDAAMGLGNTLGVGLASQMETTRASIMAFVKDGAKADQILADIRAEADKTPFAFKDMAGAMAGLIPSAKQANVSLMDLTHQAEILAASHPEQGLQGAAFALREAVSGDFTSIIERFDLPRTTINKLKAEGVPAMEIVRRAMGEMGYDMSLVANLAGTTEGRFSTFQDAIDGLRVAAGKPILAALGTQLDRLSAFIAQNQEQITGLATAIGTFLGNAIETVAHVVMDFVGVLQTLGRYFAAVAEDGDELNDFLVDLPSGFKLVAYVAGTVFSIFRQVADQMRGPLAAAIDVVQRALGTLAGVFSDDAFFAVQDFVQLVRANLQPILTGLAAALLTIVVPAFLTWAGAAAGAATATIIALAPVVLPLAAIAAAVFVLRKAWDEDWGGIQEKTHAVWNFIQPIFNAIFDSLEQFWTRILPELIQTWNAITNKVQEAMAAIWGVIGPVVAQIADWWKDHWDTIQRVLDLALDEMKRLLAIGFDVFTGILTAGLRLLRGDWEGAWDAIQGHFGNVWENLKGIVSDAMGILGLTIGAAVIHMGNTLLDFAATAWEAMRNAGLQMVQGILAGLSGLADAVKNALTGAVTGALTAAKNLITQNPLTVAVQTATSQVFQSARPDFAAASGGGGTQTTNVQAPGFDWGAYNAIHQGEPRNADGTVKRQAGGRVFGGWPYRIGEAGPETFVPRTDGYILPHGMAPSSGIDYGRLAEAVAGALSGMAVVLDGQTTGRLLRTQDRRYALAAGALTNGVGGLTP